MIAGGGNDPSQAITGCPDLGGFISIYYLCSGPLCYSVILIAISNCSNISNRSGLPACCHPVSPRAGSQCALIGITFVLELQCPRSVHPLTPGSWSDHADAFTPGESGVVTPHTSYCQHYIRALNETEAFCRLGIRQHLRVHLCQIHVHKTRKPASRLDLASFYLSQLDGQNKLKCSGTRRYLTVATTLSRSLS